MVTALLNQAFAKSNSRVFISQDSSSYADPDFTSLFHVTNSTCHHLWAKRHFLSRPIIYYSNCTSRFRLENVILRCGDVQPNPRPGGTADCSKSSTGAGSRSRCKPKYKFPCKICDKLVKSNPSGILCEQ